jgi:hypothetical protein
LVSAYHGNLKDGFVFTGVNAGKVKKISTVRKVFKNLKKEYIRARKASLKALF